MRERPTPRLSPTGDLRAAALRALLTAVPDPGRTRGRQHRANGLAPSRRAARRWTGGWVRPDRRRR